MKHLKLFAATCAIAGIAFVGCNKNQPDVVTGGLTGNEITFGTSMATKAVTEVDATALQTNCFNVCCVENLNASASPYLLFNEAVNYYAADAIKAGSAACWKTTSTYFWRDDTMNFYAVSPTSVEIVPSGTADTAEYGQEATIAYTLAASSTTDLVGAVAKNTSKPAAASFAFPAEGAVALTFKHLLSQLCLKVEPEDKDANLDYVLSSLTVSNGNGAATYTFGTDTWSANTSSADVQFQKNTGDAQTINGAISGGVSEIYGLTTNNEFVLFYPKQITVTAAYIVKEHDSGRVLRDFTSEGAGTKAQTFTLTQGKKTTLTVVLPSGVKPIYFTVTVEDWTTESQSVILE
ncbi:MAG: fimbrillin family protein [Bacteroidales bacterium]|nr:fimbrillin family protein [Bacteroidales bacterium]